MRKTLKLSILVLLCGVLSTKILFALPDDWPEDKIIVLPDMGSKHIVSAIKSAKKSIDLTLYHLDDKEVINEFINAKKKGVNVRVILNKPNLYPSPFQTTINEETEKILASHFIETHYLVDHQYTLTHSKFMIIDNDYAIVQTFNYDDFNFKKARNFGLTIEDKKQVSALSKIFEKDFNGKSAENDTQVLNLWNEEKIILGPEKQRTLISDLLKTTKESVLIYQQDLSDSEFGKILVALAKEKKTVNVLMVPVPFGGIDNNRINQTKITAFGGEFRFHPKTKLYIHAKVILIDPGEENEQMYVGSCNLWPEALSGNRELGIVTRDKLSIQSVYKTFQSDWQTALAYEEAKLIDDTSNK